MGEAQEAVEQVVEETKETGGQNLVNYYTNYASDGIVGFNSETGKFDPREGYATRAADEAVGEVTGRNLQREALNRQTDRVRAEEARRQQLLEDERERQRAEDVRASRAAGRVRRTAAGGSGGAPALSLGDQRDFLGL